MATGIHSRRERRQFSLPFSFCFDTCWCLEPANTTLRLLLPWRVTEDCSFPPCMSKKKITIDHRTQAYGVTANSASVTVELGHDVGTIVSITSEPKYGRLPLIRDNKCPNTQIRVIWFHNDPYQACERGALMSYIVTSGEEERGRKRKTDKRGRGRRTYSLQWGGGEDLCGTYQLRQIHYRKKRRRMMKLCRRAEGRRERHIWLFERVITVR